MAEVPSPLTCATPPELGEEFLIRVQLVKMAELLPVTRTTPPVCKQKRKERRGKRGIDKGREITSAYPRYPREK